LRAYEKKTILDEVVFILFLSYIFSVFRGIFYRDIWTVFEEIKHIRSRAPEK
jgi:hypothetical protein